MEAQLSFDDIVRWGGKRTGAGRKVVGRPAVLHRERPVHKYWNPLHVTLRGIDGLTSFRTAAIYAAFDRAVRTTRRRDFRIVEFSVQDNHVHLIVEADDKNALRHGVTSFSVRANRLVNAACGRMRGPIWEGRYHSMELTNALQVRNALVYCLNNYRKHQGITDRRTRIDPCSSARWFTGWSITRTQDDGSRPTEEATTVLLKTAWKKHGLIHPSEGPKPI